MCIAYIYIGDCESPYRYIIAGNRDEYLDRAATKPYWWSNISDASQFGVNWKPDTDDFQRQHIHTFAGRDLVARGTWFGVRARKHEIGKTENAVKFRFGILTNVGTNDKRNNTSTFIQSRGDLIPQFLSWDCKQSVKQYLRDLIRDSSDKYSGFNLILGDIDGAYYSSNAQQDRGQTKPLPLCTGSHGLSNGHLDDSSPKVQVGKKRFSNAIENHLLKISRDETHPTCNESDLVDTLFNILHDSKTLDHDSIKEFGEFVQPDAQQFNRIFIKPFEHKNRMYGTRTSYTMLVRKDGTISFFDHPNNPQCNIEHHRLCYSN